MEVDCQSQEENCAENIVHEQLESSTTDDSSGVYQYYPHIDFMNPATCRKVRSRLGKRRTTRNPFRISTDITEHTNETNNSITSNEDSCSDVISGSVSTCPSFPEKIDFALRKTKSNTALDQENCPAPSSGQNMERHGFRNVSNSINNTNFKSAVAFFVDKTSATDTSQPENVQDIFYIPKTEPKIPNSFHNTDTNHTYKTPLKQMTDNVFTGSATKANYNHIHQPNAIKNLFGSKFIADTAKENAPNFFDPLKGNKKPQEAFSTLLQNEKNSMYALKKFEPQNHSRGKQAETNTLFKSLSRASSLNDLPLDLKIKFKSEKMGFEQVLGNSNERAKSRISEVKKEPEENHRPKLNLDIDSRDFINILEMPSVRKADESPSKAIYSSFSSLPKNPNMSVNQSTERVVPNVKRQSCQSSPQESIDSATYSVLNLSVDNSAKTSNQVNSPILETENSQVNQLNTTKEVSNIYSETERRNNERRNNGHGFNSERNILKKENMFGKNLFVAAASSEQTVKQAEKVAPLVFQNVCPDSKPVDSRKLETEKNIFQSCNKENERFESPNSVENKPVPEFKAPTVDTRYLAQEMFKKPAAQVLPMKLVAPDPFKKPMEPLATSGGGSGIPVSVSQSSSINTNFVLPKLNSRPNKAVYSFASDVAKFCQKEGGAKLSLLKTSQSAPLSNVQVIKVNSRSYQILSHIGRGGSSEVYLVLDPNNKTLMAIKVVKLASVDESIAEGYMNEVKLLEKLQDCPSVIRMFDYEYIQDIKKLYVVMEKGDTDLSRLLKDINKNKKISMSMIIYYWTEMLTAVQEIHEKGIIHSDLKPANFLLVSGRLKLIDFGIASSLQGDMTSVHKDICTGTENYMSPEALQDGTGSSDKKYKISYKSDVWSLGCILYNLIYGKTPFSHITTRWGKMYAIISSSHKIDFPDHPMPPVLRYALQSCLIRDPKQRATVKELLELSYHTPALPKDLPLKIQQILPKEYWQKISHLFSEALKSNASQGK